MRVGARRGDSLTRFELPQLRLNFLDVSPVPFSDPGLVTGAPHLGIANGHTASVPGENCWSRNERRGGVCQGGEYEFGWNGFAESAIDFVHFFAFCVCFLFLVEEGVGGRGHWTHGKVIDTRSPRGGKWVELGLLDTTVIQGNKDRIEMKDERRGTMGILGAA